MSHHWTVVVNRLAIIQGGKYWLTLLPIDIEHILLLISGLMLSLTSLVGRVTDHEHCKDANNKCQNGIVVPPPTIMLLY